MNNRNFNSFNVSKKIKGVFITFEGIDGSGKTTQIELLNKYLINLGVETVLTREPGGTKLGESLREILLNPEFKGISSLAECFLFLASRAELVEKVIMPALEQKKVVICDRFFDSTIVYQGIARGLAVKDIYKMSLWATKKLVPDITFLLSINVNESEKRIDSIADKIRDRIEFEENDFKQKIQDGYLWLAKKFSKRIKVIDAGMDIDSISNYVKSMTFLILKKKKII